MVTTDEIFKRLLFVPVIIIIVSILILVDAVVKNMNFPLGVVKAAEREDSSAGVGVFDESLALMVVFDNEEADNESLLDLNSASVEELDELPQIGEIRAKAIVEQREKMGGFRSVGDVMCTPGVGPAVLLDIIEGMTRVSENN